MLVRFVTSNFLSFNEEVELNMIAASFKSHRQHLYDSKVKVLKGGAIYGPNGSGKSNLVKAIEFFKNMVAAGELTKSINDYKFKLNADNRDKPTLFEFEFLIDGFFPVKQMYVYGVEINGRTILAEWLYNTQPDKKPQMIFERKWNQENGIHVQFGKGYKKESKKFTLLVELLEENLLRPHELLLGKLDILKDVLEKIGAVTLKKVWEYIAKKIVVIHPSTKFHQLIPLISTNEKFKEEINKFLKAFQVGIQELRVEKSTFEQYFRDYSSFERQKIIDRLENTPNGKILENTPNGEVLIEREDERIVVKWVMAIHKDNKGKKVPFLLTSESDGTRRLIDFLPLMVGLFYRTKTTFIIDEIDLSIHLKLLYTIVKKIMEEQHTGGQLIFTTHESQLLDMDIFRPDEIWFMEKDVQSGSSQLYSLSEFKPRTDLNIRKGYLNGRFGAIPFTKELEEITINNGIQK